MSATGILTGNALAKKVWVNDYFEKYLDQLVLKPYMGTSAASLIHMKEDLARQGGDALTFALLGALEGEGVSGDATLEGSEEELPSYSQQVVIDQFRNAIKTTGRLSDQRYPFEIRDAMRPALLNWQQQFVERKVFLEMQKVDGVLYTAASTGQKDTWTVNNRDRLLFGAVVSNYNATHATALGNVDASADILNPAQITTAKTVAKLADPHIRPIRMENGEEVFVLFAHPKCTRDLKQSDDWKNANRYAMPRGDSNPLFTGALGIFDNVIVVESQKVPIISGVGASTIDVAQNFLCGAQAILWAQGGMNGDRMSFVEKEFDYDNQVGVAVASMWNVAKARFAVGAAGVTKDHGIVHVYSAAV